MSIAREAFGRRMRQGGAAALLIGGAFMLSATGARAAGVPGQTFFTVGGGSSTMGILTQNCPDIPCNGAAACSCVEATGNVKFSTLQGSLPPTGTFTLEVSVDRRTVSSNGGGGVCYNGTGILGLTTVKGTLTIPFSGPACRLGAGTHISGSVPFGMSVPAYISAGTGKYVNPTGTGTFNGSINPSTNSLLIDLTGLGIL